MVEVKITIERIQLLLEHRVDVFPVTLETKRGVWDETLRSEHDLVTFLRGVEAGCAMLGTIISLPEVPRQPTKQLK